MLPSLLFDITLNHWCFSVASYYTSFKSYSDSLNLPERKIYFLPLFSNNSLLSILKAWKQMWLLVMDILNIFVLT